jgi:hypothetical protein
MAAAKTWPETDAAAAVAVDVSSERRVIARDVLPRDL